MRLVSYDAGDGVRAGILDDDGIRDAGRGGLGALLRSGETPSAGGPVVENARLLPPVPDPQKVLLLGLNYRSHAEEAGLEPPETPTFFAKFRNALVPHGAEVPLPGYSQKVDYEAEVAFVIGRRAKDVAEADALDHIAGYTLLNDLSARDLQFSTPQWMSGKVFDGSAPCGPALVTPEEAGRHDGIEIRLTLNGEQMQSDSTASLIFSVPALLSHLSQLMTLEPGDIVSTGTPDGVGSVREPRVWLADGDELIIESPTLGRLETRIAG
ncbi:MAG TPA: fumarylacetoacetate hydrolase family protein [Solirubrobacterales bacterium]|nr:fumarylacetoacetate hydrolase family protein [Solirubrobacterales bacterium]